MKTFFEAMGIILSIWLITMIIFSAGALTMGSKAGCQKIRIGWVFNVDCEK